MSEKLCMFCKHLTYEDGGGGEYAPPSSLNCAKKHFKDSWGDKTGEHYVYDIEDFRAIIVQAENCKDYSPPR
jgi:hypothetical protein